MSEMTFGNSGDRPRDFRPVYPAVKRGFLGRCPHCGEGKLFTGFVKPADTCPVCGEELHHQRADDFPAYLNILIVGHIVVGAFAATAVLTNLPGWLHLAIWTPLLLIMSVVLMQPIKGAVIGFQWANYMHGFGGVDEFAEYQRENES